jgi:hypothetical protein
MISQHKLFASLVIILVINLSSHRYLTEGHRKQLTVPCYAGFAGQAPVWSVSLPVGCVTTMPTSNFKPKTEAEQEELFSSTEPSAGVTGRCLLQNTEEAPACCVEGLTQQVSTRTWVSKNSAHDYLGAWLHLTLHRRRTLQGESVCQTSV